MGAALLELRAIAKAFPGCQANDGVDLNVRAGEIHALLGENGAGKSTLVKIIYGVLAPDSGEIRWEGRGVRITGPAHARRLGIGMVFQHFSIFEALTVVENVALGIDWRGRLDDLRRRLTEVSGAYGLPLSPDAVVHGLSVGERQRIEVVRCLLQEPRLLIMDEPTSVLTPQEAEALFATLRHVAAEGCAILYISHKLAEIRALCEHATVMRQGKVVAECDPRRESSKRLAALMLGDEPREPHRQRTPQAGPPRLAVESLSLAAEERDGVALAEVCLRVGGGEILGIAGIAGNGQGELMAALSGEVRSPAAETIAIDGVAVGRLGPGARRALGAAFIPEERYGHAAVPALTLAENALLSAHRRRALVRHGLIAMARTRAFAEAIIRRFDVRGGGAEAEARNLSGGNLQKFVVGRELVQEPGVLVAAQPTWGIDAGAAMTVHQALLDLADAGAAIVVISQDLDEIFAICDSIAVLAAGRLSPPVPVREASIEAIGLTMGGPTKAAAE